MKTQHTPKPWRCLKIAEGRGNDIVIRTDDGGDERRICTVHNDAAHSNPEVAANSALIMAAPEMLEALVLSEQAMMEIVAPGQHNVMDAIREARLAIKKALGGQL